MKAIALDDEPPALRLIERFSAGNEKLELVKTYTQPGEAIKHLKKYPVDLIFIDIQINDKNGIDIYRKLEVKPLLIFTTAFAEYAVEGFNINAVDYLLKPYTQERFNQAVDKAYEQYKNHIPQETGGKTLFVRSNYTLVKIPVADIWLIESFDDYITIYHDRDKQTETRMTLKSVIEQLPENDFIRVHRSYIVAIGKVERVRNKTIANENKKIPIGNKYEKEFFDRFSI